MSFNWTEIFKASMVLFAVIDIIGSIPIILDIKKRAGDIHPGRASLVALGIMLLFFFIGEDLIGLFGIGIEEFAVAGAFVLFFLALEMILGIDLFKQDDKSMKSATIVPVAFPLIAGAGTMTSIISLQAEYQSENILVAIVVNIDRRQTLQHQPAVAAGLKPGSAPWISYLWRLILTDIL